MLEEWVNQIPVGAVLAGLTFLMATWTLFKKIRKELTETTSGWFKRAFLVIIDDEDVMKKLSEKQPPSKQSQELMTRLDDLAGAQDYLSGRFQEMMATVESVHSDVGSLAMETRKNFLVQCISNIEQGEKMEEIEMERFHESYAKYLDDGGNSYIKGRVEKLKTEGKL